jgi:hypothetical protein
LSALIAAGRTVCLHGTEGVGCSPTIAIGYLHWSPGWGFDAAVCHVKQARQCSPHFETVRLTLWNPMEPRQKRRALNRSSGGILRLGRFRLFARCRAQVAKKPPHYLRATNLRRKVMRRRSSVPASRGFWNWMREPITELREWGEPYERQLKRREPHLLQLLVDCCGHVGVEDKLETAAHCGSSLLWSRDFRLAPESEASVCAWGHSLTCPITGAIGSPACRHIETATEDDSCRVLAAESG